ncbi:hypothetical protein F511_43682 [Dorcoceras hygrometricum]|uniref:Dystroglycan-like n=1 Tax=Dorcoceras hygrometricum TaxID=472368 RepID=A0A2Z7A597_9LAMI|nr:hypothetical protein F511_43682 [Dorcoceras hygrometricum]
MASSLISSSHHIDFDSVFGIDDAGMVQMFESLIATGLKEFLGCPAVFSEAALTEFFANSSVRDGMVVSTIKGKPVEISEEVFATTFELPTEGLTDLSEVPKNLVFDAQSLFSVSQEQVSIYCFKKEMEIQYRLLNDILAKTIYVKAGSFDAVTRDRFLLMTAITFDVKVNWIRLLFDVLKDMVTPSSRQAKGYTIQICVLLKNIPGLELDSQHVQLPSSLVSDSPIVQIEQSAAFADTDEQMDIDLSDDSSLHFDDTDPAAASISLPAAPIPDVTEALNQLRASIEQISERDDGAKHKDTLLLHLHNFESNLTACLDAHDRVLGALRKDSNDQRNLMTLELKSYHKQLSTQIATTGLDVVDVRRVVREHHQELNAKITSLDEKVAATRNDLLDFSAQAQQTLNIITDQLSELVAYINRGGNDKKGEVSSSRPQPPPDVQNRGSGNTSGGGATDIAQRDFDNAQRIILERLMTADRARERERRSKSRSGSGSYKRRR